MSFLTAVLLCYTNHQYAVYFAVCLAHSLSFSFSLAVFGTRGIMGLSYSRQDIDALNSNIKLFLAIPDMSSSLHFSCLTGLECVRSMNHDTASNLLGVIHTFCWCFLCKVVSPPIFSLFICPQMHMPHFHGIYQADDIIPHKPFLWHVTVHVFKCDVDVCLVVYLHLHLIRDTLNSHNALSQCHQVSEKAHCNVKRKLPLVEFTQTDQK